MPTVVCPACHLSIYIGFGHGARPTCPNCDAPLRPPQPPDEHPQWAARESGRHGAHEHEDHDQGA